MAPPICGCTALPARATLFFDAELRHLASIAPPDAHLMFNNIPRVRDAQRFMNLAEVNSRLFTPARPAERTKPAGPETLGW